LTSKEDAQSSCWRCTSCTRPPEPFGGLAEIVFFVALVLFLISLIAGGVRGGFGRRL
jgi:hypothetical protein